jgi:phosphatidylinositol glycan class O
MLSGGLSTFFETSTEFGSSQVTEDNILYQLKQRRKNSKIAFHGDYIWDPLYGQYFDRKVLYNSLDLRDLDTLDNGVLKGFSEELKSGSDFDLMLGHIIGVDSAGHSFFSDHPEIERKLRDTESIIAQVMELMDDQTTLLVFGDHGMTDSGNHGGGSLMEMRTVMFAYQKTAFPMVSLYKRHKDVFDYMDIQLKQVDLAPILSLLLDVPFPYSSVGVIHPLFAMTNSASEVNDIMLNNLEQIQTYLQSYCDATKLNWCGEQVDSFADYMTEFRAVRS